MAQGLNNKCVNTAAGLLPDAEKLKHSYGRPETHNERGLKDIARSPGTSFHRQHGHNYAAGYGECDMKTETR